MSKMLIPLLLALAALGIGIFIYYNLYAIPTLPPLDYNRWWGEGSKGPNEDADTSIRAFKIEFNNTMITDLKARLANRRPLPKPLEGINFEYGTNSDYLQGILNYWEKEYDFKQREQILNKYPRYKTKVQGLDIQFVWAKPTNIAKPSNAKGLKVLPILMIHGWPSSSKEFLTSIPFLTTPRKGYEFVFEVVAVDLPGFGYSEATRKPGLNPVEMGIIMHNLMHRLGHKKYYIHAGDWGAQCATHMAILFQDEILGLHSTFLVSSKKLSVVKLLIGSIFPGYLNDDPNHLKRIYPLKTWIQNLVRDSGYFHIQATKPDAIGIALSASPDGLAGYVLNILALGTDRSRMHKPDGGLVALDVDDILDTLSVLWFNNCVTAATRIYAEATWFHPPYFRDLHEIPTYVPAASINFLYEVLYNPPSVLRDKFPNLVHVTTPKFGGHFAGLEKPELLTDDIFDATVEFLKFHSRNGVKSEL